MPEVFISKRASNRRHVILQMLMGITIIASWPLFRIFYLHKPFDPSYYFVAGSFLIVFIIRAIVDTRIISITFQTDTGEIVFEFEKLLTKRAQKILLYRHARLEIETYFGWRRDNIILRFFSNKLQVFKVQKSKDGFSNETLAAIIDLARKQSLTVSKY